MLRAVVRERRVLETTTDGEAAVGMSGAASVVPGPGEQLIGVAIPVPQPWASELEEYRTAFGDPLGTTVPAHVTLVPPTTVATDSLDAVRAHLASAAASCPRFTLRLDGTASFRPVSPVVFVRVTAGAGECAALEQRVRAGVLDTERRFPFHPHVTVAQQLDDAVLDRASDELAGYGAAFPVDEVRLYTHGSDGVWRSASAFALGG